MSQNVRKTGPTRGGRAPEPARRSLVIPIIIAAIFIGGAFFVYRAVVKSPTPPLAPPNAGAPETAAETVPTSNTPTATSSPMTGAETAPTPSPVIKPAAAAVAVVEPAPAPQLIGNLTNLDVTQGITASEAQGWKESLRQLARQGASGVPVIQAFLAQNWDVNYTGVNAEQLGYPSLRAGMLDALAQIGGAEATAAMLQILQTSAFPSDVADLAKGLGQVAPGQYQQEIVSAVRQQLFMASQQPTANNADVGPLFQVLATQGANGAPIAQDVQQYGAKWPFYSAITLANLPEGTGLPGLLQMAQGSEGGQTIAVDTLAQMSSGNPQALSALLEMARSGQLSDFVLASAAPFLAGQQYALAAPAEGLPGGVSPVSIHMVEGNQNFLSVSGGTPAQIGQQIGMIDQLLQAVPASDTGALQALQQQKILLSNKAGR